MSIHSNYAGLNQEITELLKKINKLENKITEENREKIEKKIALSNARLKGLMKQKNALAELSSFQLHM